MQQLDVFTTVSALIEIAQGNNRTLKNYVNLYFCCSAVTRVFLHCAVQFRITSDFRSTIALTASI